MDRKKAIIMAVLLNAGLLCVLFLVFMQTKDEEISRSAVATERPMPLFEQEMPIASLPRVGESLEERQNSIVHQLPPLAIESPVPLATVPIEAIPPSAPIAPSPLAFIEVQVQKGDSLDKLARLHHTTMEEILKLNQLSGNILRVGQVLKIPQTRSVAAKPKLMERSMPNDPSPEYYTVKVGDNPWGIAMKHHMKVDELLKLNNLNEERARRLKPGDRLRIR